MLSGRKIDLALEAKELAGGFPQKTTRLSGVKAQKDTLFGYPPHPGGYSGPDGEAALGETQGGLPHPGPAPAAPGPGGDPSGCPGGGGGPGGPACPAQNRDSFGGRPGQPPGDPGRHRPAQGTEFLLVTRHLVAELPEDFGTLRPVAALAAGVTGSTGMESGEILGAVVEKLRPACLIAVDALAARRQERVCRTIQVSDTGIVPGSGVGNARMALDQAHLGIPVIAIGVPTVVEAATLCLDLLEEEGGNCLRPRPLPPAGGGVVRHPRNIDRGGGNPCPHPGPWDQHRPSCGFFRGRCGKVDLLTRYSTMLDK